MRATYSDGEAIREGDLVVVAVQCRGEDNDCEEVDVPAGSTARVYRVGPEGVSFLFPNGVTNVFEGEELADLSRAAP